MKMTDMSANIAQLKTELTSMVEAANDLDSLEAARVQALGKKGKITDLMKTLGQMSEDERKTTGAALNVLKDEIAGLIARQESAFNVSAVSPANAKGLLQLLPGTAKMMAKKTGVKYQPAKLTTDAAYNATLGAAYLSEQLDNFDNSYILTFAGYNAGPGRVRQWIDTYGDPRGKKIEDVVDWIERIPFTETRNYVQRVMENYQVYKVRLSNSRLDIEGDLRQGRR